jgi:hypothetical protein
MMNTNNNVEKSFERVGNWNNMKHTTPMTNTNNIGL